MKRKKIFLTFTFFVVLLAMTTLTRCGSGLGEGYDASVCGMKF